MKQNKICNDFITLVDIVNSSKELFELVEPNSKNMKIILPYSCKSVHFSEGKLKFLMNYNLKKRFFAFIATQRIDDEKLMVRIISNDKNFMNSSEGKTKSFEYASFKNLFKEYIERKILENFEAENDYRCH